MKFWAVLMMVAVMTFSCAADELVAYVGKEPAKVTLEQGTGKVITQLKEGYLCTIVERQGDYAAVLLNDGRCGWVKDSDGKAFESTRADYQKLVSEVQNRHIRADNIPVDMERAASPLKIVVSLKGLTVHVMGPEIDKVYPVGVGVKGSNGKSITPTCEQQNVKSFYLHADPTNNWYYMKNRYEPAYFGGYPFIRTSIVNSSGYNTYGFHGPITKRNGKWYLQRGYVSHGCMRMQGEDVTELYNIVVKYPRASVIVQEDYDYNADGKKVDINYPKYH